MKLLFCSALLCCSAKAAWVQHPAVRFSGGATVPRAAVAATATEADPSAVKEEKYEFEAEVSKVMDIIINSLYSDKVRPPYPDRPWCASRQNGAGVHTSLPPSPLLPSRLLPTTRFRHHRRHRVQRTCRVPDRLHHLRPRVCVAGHLPSRADLERRGRVR